MSNDATISFMTQLSANVTVHPDGEVWIDVDFTDLEEFAFDGRFSVAREVSEELAQAQYHGKKHVALCIYKPLKKGEEVEHVRTGVHYFVTKPVNEHGLVHVETVVGSETLFRPNVLVRVK